MKNIVLILLFFSVSFLYVKGQEGYTPNIVPPSPNSSSLGKFVDIPVSNYTGIPQVSVPIYEIKSGNLMMPISIDYHAGGIKVDEIASNVGLGWTLKAGGVISRTVRGYPDDCNRGYLHPIFTGPIQPSYNQSNHQEFSKLKEYATGGQDGQPDVFNFNFCGRTGSFSFKENGEIIQQPLQKIRIDAVFSGFNISGWSLTTEDGTVYIFSDKEFMSSYTECSDVTGYSQSRGECNGFDLASSWYLTKIIPAVGSEINFFYNINTDNWVDNYSYSIKSVYPGSETVYTESFLGAFSNYGCQLQRRRTYCESIVETLGKRLSKITFDGGEVQFIPGFQRADLVGDRTLEKIIIRDYNNNIISQYKLRYGYTPQIYSENAIGYVAPVISSNDNLRLTLFSISELDASNNSKPPYKFSYYGGLPNRFSLATDYWGYYNGKEENGTRIPYIRDFNSNVTFSGSNRNVFFNFAKAGTLYKIEYPTGGFSEFTFEANDCTTPGAPPRYNEIASTVSLESYPMESGDTYSTSYPWIKTKNFTINNTSSSESMVIINMTMNCVIPYSCAARFQIYNSNNQIVFNSTTPSLYSVGNSGLVNYSLILPNGTYKIEYVNNDNQYYPTPYNINSINLKWHESLGGNKAAGGLRVKLVDHFDPTSGITNSKLYNYNLPNGPYPPIDGVSSGSLVNHSVLNYTYEFIEVFRPDCFSNCIIGGSFPYLVIQSNPNYSFAVTKGGNVGYKNVTEYQGRNYNNNSGRIEYVYTSPIDYPDLGIGSFPFAPFDSREYKRGLLLSKIESKFILGTYQPIMRVDNEYEFIGIENSNANIDQTTGIIVDWKKKYTACNGILGYPDSEFSFNYFNFSSGYNQLLKTVETLYVPGTTESSINVKEFFYENLANILPTKTITSNSNGESLTTVIKYPHDYNSFSPYSLMINNNIINSVVEKVEENSSLNKEIYRLKINYSLSQGNIVMSSIQKSFEGNTLLNEINFTKHDVKGNVLEYTAKDGIVNSFIWGYNSLYPVARIVGKNYDDAISQSNIDMSMVNNPLNEDVLQTELNKLRTLNNCLVSTATYKPLVGKTRETDERGRITYYEYDQFNRLSFVKDHEGNNIKRICYNYYGQQEDCVASNDIVQWTNTGNYRCQPCSLNTNYLSNIREREEIDPTTNTTRWVVEGEGACVSPPDWKEVFTRCQEVPNSGYTGFKEIEYVDENPCSQTYGHPKYEIVQDNTNCATNCSSVCQSPNYHCVNGICEEGTWECISVVAGGEYIDGYICTYAYCFSDGFISNYTVSVNSPTSCTVTCY